MKIDIDNICDQIIRIQFDDLDKCKIIDVKLDFGKEYEYDTAMSYIDAYDYLCESLLIDARDKSSQKILDLFLIHQYLCYCYLSGEEVDHLRSSSDDWNEAMNIVRECFSVYRMVGAFQACAAQYEILAKSSVWQEFDDTKKMQITKEAAKSYRNIGDFYNALKLYYECLTWNPEHDWLQRMELLMKIGKVYRNYLMQAELARFFVEEAYAILEKNGLQKLDGKKERKYAVICLDTLGQIYRDEQNYEKAEAFFAESNKLYGKKGGRASIHKILMKYQQDSEEDEDLAKDIRFLEKVIESLQKNPSEEVGIGIRSVQLGHLKFRDKTGGKKEAYHEVYKGRDIAYKYNDIKTVVLSYIEEADFLKQEKKYADYVKISKAAVKFASDSNQLVLENRIIKDIIELSNTVPDIIDSTTKIELIKRRKDIYNRLVKFSKYSINIVQNGISDLFSKDKLIDIYGIVLDDFEKILDELNVIIEILNIEIDKINQKYIAYLNTEIKGFAYKSILHKFKNDLPNGEAINELRSLCDSIQQSQPECRDILIEANKQLGTFADIIAHIKQSLNEALKESEQEKEWCSLDSLIQTGIQNFVYSKPRYAEIIHYGPAECNINILVQRTLFETTISEILHNAFDYVENEIDEKENKEKFQFFINLKVIERRAFAMECYSYYWDSEIAKRAGISIEKGMERRKAESKEGSRYGFHSMKFLFEDLMGGKITLLQENNKAGIRIQWSFNKVTLRIEEGDKING